MILYEPLSVRRLYCENPACEKVTFAEQVPGLTRRYQRRMPALQTVVDAVAVALAGSAGARLLSVLHQALSWACVLNCLMRIALPARPVPHVVGIDEFALRRGHRYATILVDATTGERIDVLPDRRTETVTAWLQAHPGIHVVCRDGAGGFAQATADADSTIVQVCDRWHLWHGLAEAAQKEVAAHSTCWAKAGPPLREGTRAQTTRERWQQIHQLLDAGVGLLECSRRLVWWIRAENGVWSEAVGTRCCRWRYVLDVECPTGACGCVVRELGSVELWVGSSSRTGAD